MSLSTSSQVHDYSIFWQSRLFSLSSCRLTPLRGPSRGHLSLPRLWTNSATNEKLRVGSQNNSCVTDEGQEEAHSLAWRWNKSLHWTPEFPTQSQAVLHGGKPPLVGSAQVALLVQESRGKPSWQLAPRGEREGTQIHMSSSCSQIHLSEKVERARGVTEKCSLHPAGNIRNGKKCCRVTKECSLYPF